MDVEGEARSARDDAAKALANVERFLAALGPEPAETEPPETVRLRQGGASIMPTRFSIGHG